MHLQIISVMCCFLLSVHGYTEDDNCKKNVPRSVQETLLEVIKKKCKNPQELKNLSYDCKLGVKAFEGKSANNEGSDLSAYEFTYFGGKSTFNFDWKTTLSEVIENADNMTDPIPFPVTTICGIPATKIGCHIDLSTTEGTGIHELSLRCNYK